MVLIMLGLIALAISEVGLADGTKQYNILLYLKNTFGNTMILNPSFHGH